MKRWIVGGISLFGLLIVFLFQHFNVASLFGISDPLYGFLANRTTRFLLNDVFMIGLIYALFVEKRFVVFALWVQLIGMFCFLLPYFIFKLYYPAYNGPLVSYLHRLILNPTLLLLLIPAFYYQRKQQANKKL